jgi:hypothetical protein
MSIVGAAEVGSAAGVVAAVVGVVVPAVSSVLSPQAAMEKANRTAAEMAVNLVARIGVDPFVVDFTCYSVRNVPRMGMKMASLPGESDVLL